MSEHQYDMNCPNCGPVPPHEIIGHEIRGVYDGVLYWVHDNGVCGLAFQRFTGYRAEWAQPYIERHNLFNETKRGDE
jgi:hypothetical protein